MTPLPAPVPPHVRITSRLGASAPTLKVVRLLGLCLAALTALGSQASVARAGEPPMPKLAVLMLKVDSKAVSLDEASTLTDVFRSRIIRASDGRMKVIAKEKVVEILKSMHKDAVQCSSECEIETAREIGADYVASGSISAISGRTILVLEVKRSRDGVAVASRDVSSQAAELYDKLGPAADALTLDLLKKLPVDKVPDAREAPVASPAPAKAPAEAAPKAPAAGSKPEKTEAKQDAPGGCDKADIAANVRARAATLRACYESQLFAQPDLNGRITVQWTIQSDGKVASLTAVEDTMHNAAVTQCVLRAIGRITFAKPAAGICVIQWPFAFTPG